MSMKVNSVNSNSNLKSKLACAGAISAGVVLGGGVPVYTLADTFSQSVSASKSAANFMRMFMPDVDTFENTAKNIKQIITDTGLDKKGVKFNAINSESAESLQNLRNIIDKNEPSKKSFIQKLKNSYFNVFKEGANAGYFTSNKDVVVNQNNLYTSAYHEIGHAMNANGNFATKALQKARVLTPLGVSIVAPIALAVGLFHKVDNTKPKEEKGKVERTLDFISNNAGKLTLASYVPMLAEEGLASIRGLNQAKKFLSPDKFSKLAGNYAKAWGTYALTAGLIAGGVALGIAVCNGIKDKFSKKDSQTV